jgi:hypothetical protein
MQEFYPDRLKMIKRIDRFVERWMDEAELSELQELAKDIPNSSLMNFFQLERRFTERGAWDIVKELKGITNVP